MRYVGPRLDDADWALGEWEAPPGDDPLVLASLSSDFQDQEGVLRRIVQALGTLPVRGVVTTGLGVDPSVVTQVPDNVLVVRSAPHNQVLATAAACLTHCGHGTTIKALAHGVPVVGIPMGRDQHDVAARVVHRGAGLRLDATSAPADIAAAVRRVLDDPSYAEAAARIATAIRSEVAEDRAVVELEALAAEPGAVSPKVSASV